MYVFLEELFPISFAKLLNEFVFSEELFPISFATPKVYTFMVHSKAQQSRWPKESGQRGEARDMKSGSLMYRKR